eukprot:m.80214 g.80214  ORF g.80214 m.80214 type:complete len:299 (+) comp14832_c0_seq2:755-1651(+)
MVLNWHIANLEYGNATVLGNLSLQHWDQDDGNEFTGTHCVTKDGFSIMPRALSVGLDIRLNSAVKHIEYSDKGVSVTYVDEKSTNVHTLEAAVVLITVPLGVLKEGVIRYTPPLPEWKQSAINRLGFGVLNKVILCFQESFWEDRTDLFGFCDGKPVSGELFLFWNFYPATKQPVLVALTSGVAALNMEEMNEADIIRDAVAVLRKIFKRKIVPNPIHSAVTKWRSDRFARGSYSYVAVGATGSDYDHLAAPVEVNGTPRLCFAGEHTARYHPATVQGAFLSGVREAARITEKIPQWS